MITAEIIEALRDGRLVDVNDEVGVRVGEKGVELVVDDGVNPREDPAVGLGDAEAKQLALLIMAARQVAHAMRNADKPRVSFVVKVLD